MVKILEAMKFELGVEAETIGEALVVRYGYGVKMIFDLDRWEGATYCDFDPMTDLEGQLREMDRAQGALDYVQGLLQ